MKTGRRKERWDAFPASAAEVCAADAGRYNTRAVLSKGAFDVQSIRASQTADPRAKQTHPSGPARRSARVNAKLADGGSPGSMPAGRFHSGELVGSLLSHPLFGWPSSTCGCTTACVVAANLDRWWIGVDISLKAVDLVNIRLQQSMGDLLHNRLMTARTDITSCTDIDAPVPYQQNKHMLFGSRRVGATDAAASSRSASWRWITSSLAAVAAKTTSKTCSYCTPTAIGLRVIGRRNTWWPRCGNWVLRRRRTTGDYASTGRSYVTPKLVSRTGPRSAIWEIDARTWIRPAS